MKAAVMIAVLWIVVSAVLFLSPRGSGTGFVVAVAIVLGLGLLIAFVTPAGR